MAYKTQLGSAASTTSAATLIVTTTAAVAAGDLVVVRVATDNLSGSTPTFAATDSGGNTYTTLGWRAQGTTASAGAACAIIATRATAAIPAGGTITVTLSAPVAARAAYAESFTDTGLSIRAQNTGGQGSASQASTGAASAQIGDLVLAVNAVETSAALTGDPDTIGGTWSALTWVLANGGTSTASMTVAGQWKIPNTATTQTQGASWTGVTDYAAVIVVLVPEVYVPPVIPPTDPGHVEIGGRTYCVPAHGVAIRVEVQTPTQLLDVTDLIVRAAWEQGGAYDAGLPWYSPTPNPAQLELEVNEPRWDPTAAGAFDLVPLVTTVRIALAEQATFGTGNWSLQARFYGPLLAHTYEPHPGGGATVVITAADALTNLGDMIADERPEETPWDRLTYLASNTRDLAFGFSPVDLGGPMLGRYHPDAALTRLELMVSTALAAGQALMFQPTDADPLKTTVYSLPQGTFGWSTDAWFAAVDPDAGMVGAGYFPAENMRVACLTDLELGRTEAGLRTRIRSGRVIAPWVIATNRPGPASVPMGNHYWQSPSFTGWPGDKFELHTQSSEALTYGGANPTFRTLVNPHAAPGQAPFFSPPDISPKITGEAWENRFPYEVPPELGGSFVMGRYWIQPTSGQTLTFPASYTETVSRLGDTGDEIETVIAARETTYGQRAVAGWRSPILKQADLAAWNSRALGWVTAPSYYPRVLRVASTAAHRSPGAQQWAVQVVAGQRLSIRHVETPDAPTTVTLNTWAVNVTTTFTSTECTLDVECGPLTSGVA